jgi:GMP synthase (glutamine-hydrolysing)
MVREAGPSVAAPPLNLVVLQAEADAGPGHLTDWARDRGVELDVVDVCNDPELPSPEGYAGAVALGSDASWADARRPAWMERQLAWLGEAERAAVPVLGICFGAQHLARTLGGTAARAASPEIGWMEVESLAPSLIAPGPWMQWHGDAFTPPPGAELLARSAVCTQAFAVGPHLAVQFHPEVTPAVAAGWARTYADAARRAGVDPATIAADSERHGVQAARAAFALFDGFLARARAAAPRTARMHARTPG